ncbi:peroxiredoxin [Candidatus Methylopumilus turicensis]|uniref:Alkyl hydroperoxide reductase/ Thiol specific antioxidant/ Mal allergen n=1 Tax=Candidatus Methylopumilus turicensis TaxID=1581680 RepID=A0A0B7J0Z0_9PROT|nr:peroxiredoxin [Candidatus Methylopumilus turicensis]CEN56447.1 Alkyl hydroperoxide reductase/ Thiol specific antioxidant/ Mal allergen [Candidatus Methylopumilus turicensis]
MPINDGLADHLLGISLPSLSLLATNGSEIDLSKVKGRFVVYCYPRTGTPNTSLPEGWDQIPGARGCTPQSLAYRDHYQALKALGVEVFGLSVQTTEYQTEMVSRLDLPFPVLSDNHFELQRALNLPTFEVAGMILLKRLTLIVKDGVVEAVHYPVFPSDSDPTWVLGKLGR